MRQSVASHKGRTSPYYITAKRTSSGRSKIAFNTFWYTLTSSQLVLGGRSASNRRIEWLKSSGGEASRRVRVCLQVGLIGREICEM